MMVDLPGFFGFSAAARSPVGSFRGRPSDFVRSRERALEFLLLLLLSSSLSVGIAERVKLLKR